MFEFKNLSIRNKLTLIIMVSVLISIFSLSSIFVVYEYQSQKQHMVDEFSTTAKIIADQSQAALAFNDVDSLEENLRSIRLNEEVVTACFYGLLSNLLASYASEEFGTQCPENPQAQLRVFEDDLYMHSEEVSVDGDPLGLFYVEVSLSGLYKQLSIYLGLMAIFITVVCFGAFVISRYLQEYIASPLLNLTDTANKVSQTRDYSLHATKEGNDEIGMLVDSFNDMLDKVKAQNEDILKYTEELDSKVKERTVELDSANNQLEKRNNELAVANKELEAFSYSVSHDLRSPLRAIDGFTKALEEDCYDDLDELGKSYIKRARGAAQKMGELISTLLQLSRVTRKELEMESANMTDLAEQACQHLRDEDPEREISISVQAGMHATADVKLIEAAFNNLIGNAWKYTGKEEHPSIEVGCLIEQGTRVYFVKDNGAGFDKNYSQDLFTAFKRLHGDDEFEGTGIGLATVARIVHRHHGDIWATSEIGQGAQFFFTLNESRPDHHEAHASSNSRDYKKR